MSTAPPVLPSLTSGLDETWLALTQEEILDPDLPICDPHHHLWDRPEQRYLLAEFLADAGSGHNIDSTVFLECGASYRPDWPVEMRPVGEAEFVSDIGRAERQRPRWSDAVAATFVGFADLTLGARVESVLTALIGAGRGRFRGVRYSAARDDGFVMGQQSRRAASRTLPRLDVSAGVRLPGPARSDLRCLGVPSADFRGDGSGPGFPGAAHRAQSCRRPHGCRPLCWTA